MARSPAPICPFFQDESPTRYIQARTHADTRGLIACSYPIVCSSRQLRHGALRFSWHVGNALVTTATLTRPSNSSCFSRISRHPHQQERGENLRTWCAQFSRRAQLVALRLLLLSAHVASTGAISSGQKVSGITCCFVELASHTRACAETGGKEEQQSIGSRAVFCPAF